MIKWSILAFGLLPLGFAGSSASAGSRGESGCALGPGSGSAKRG